MSYPTVMAPPDHLQPSNPLCLPHEANALTCALTAEILRARGLLPELSPTPPPRRRTAGTAA